MDTGKSCIEKKRIVSGSYLVRIFSLLCYSNFYLNKHMLEQKDSNSVFGYGLCFKPELSYKHHLSLNNVEITCSTVKKRMSNGE